MRTDWGGKTIPGFVCRGKKRTSANISEFMFLENEHPKMLQSRHVAEASSVILEGSDLRVVVDSSSSLEVTFLTRRILTRSWPRNSKSFWDFPWFASIWENTTRKLWKTHGFLQIWPEKDVALWAQELYGDAVQLLFAGEKTIFAESQERFLEKWPASWYTALAWQERLCSFTRKQCDLETRATKYRFNFNQPANHSMVLFAFLACVLVLCCPCGTRMY